MPAAAAGWAVAAAFNAGIIGGSATAALVVSGIAYGATVIAIGAVVSTATSALMGSAKGGGGGGGGGGGSSGGGSSGGSAFAAELHDRLVTTRQSISPREIVYGQIRKGGTLIFEHSTGANNEYLHLVLVLADHQVQAVGEMFLDGEPVSLSGGAGTGRFAGLITVVKRLGSDDQSAISELVAAAPDKWTTAHRARGCAIVYVKLKYDQDAFPTGVPNITFDITGKNDIYDPRTASYGYTNNAALCTGDYLRSASYGLAVTTAELPDAELTAAANICDEAVPLAAGGTEKRYTTNGTIVTEATPTEIILHLAVAMGGYAVVTGGNRWWLYPGAYSAPVVALDENDFRGSIKVSTRMSRRASFNGVKGTFCAPLNLWQPTDFPALSIASYVTEDGGEAVWSDLALPLTTSPTAAQRIARLLLERNRRQITVDTTFSLRAWRAVPGETIALSYARYGWNGKVFEVAKTSLIVVDGGAIAVQVSLREIDANVFSWSVGNEQAVAQAPTTNLPRAFDPPPAPTLFTVTSGTDVLYMKHDGTIISRARLSWTDPAWLYARFVEIQYRLSANPAWTPAGMIPLGAQELYLSDVADGFSYDFRIRTLTGLDVRGPWAEFLAHTIVGKSAPPPDVVSFSAQPNGAVVTFRWAAVLARDLLGYEIRYMPIGTFVWESATVITAATKGTLITNAGLPPGAWTVGIKAVDTSLNQSLHAATYDVNAPNVNDIISGTAQGPAWTGELVGFIRHDPSGSLVPDSTSLANSLGWEIFDLFVPNPVATCTYTAPEIALGFDVSGLRLWTDSTATLGPKEVGSADPLFDIDYRLTAGSYPGFAPWSVGNVSAAFCKLRARIETATGVAHLRQFTPIVDIMTRFEGGVFTITATGGTTITFSAQFVAIPGIQVSAAAVGGEARIATYESVTSTSFVVRVFVVSTSLETTGPITFTATGA